MTIGWGYVTLFGLKFCGQRHTPNEGVVAEKGIIIILFREYIQQQQSGIGVINIFSSRQTIFFMKPQSYDLVVL